jgi:hypothetical protein
MTESGSRVKLFSLDNLGQWEDKGIGLASINDTTLEILYEDTLETALNCPITTLSPYRQSETILCWSDESYKNYAISFQQPECANLFWTSFCRILGLENIVETFCLTLALWIAWNFCDYFDWVEFKTDLACLNSKTEEIL